jgi:hypothetical protein
MAPLCPSPNGKFWLFFSNSSFARMKPIVDQCVIVDVVSSDYFPNFDITNL